MAEKEERPGQIKYVDKCGGPLAIVVGSMVDRVEVAVETIVEVAAGAVPGAGDFKTPVVRIGGIMPPGHTSRMEICRRCRIVAEMPPMQSSRSLA